jgi:hypothetical protein
MRPPMMYVNHFLAIVGGLAVLGAAFGAMAIDTMVMIGAGGTLPLVAHDLWRAGGG